MCHPDFFLYGRLCYSLKYCATYSYFYGCYTCKQNYKLYNNRFCIEAIVDRCTGYDPITGRCLQCASNFYLVSNLCIRLPEYCEAVDRTGACTRCIEGYSTVNGKCERKNKDPNCLVEEGDKCTQCVNNYYINADSKCTPYPPYCVTVRQDGYCLACVSGYKTNPQTGICQFVPIPQNCEAYDIETNICLKCLPGFNPRDGLCYRVIPNCLNYGANETCLVCASGFNVSPSRRYCIYDNCAIQAEADTICRQCLQNYEWRIGACRRIIEFCK